MTLSQSVGKKDDKSQQRFAVATQQHIHLTGTSLAMATTEQLPRLPPSPPPTPTLPAEINASTKQQHDVLNSLITNRLPLALPPHAPDLTFLGLGLATFAQIYFNLEDAWQEVVDSLYSSDTTLCGTHDVLALESLATMRPRGMKRSLRLEHDLQHISKHTGVDTPSIDPAQRQMLRRMRTNIRAKPHTLIAYGWVMYMAIFSGGRWIKQKLSDAGPGFWHDQGRHNNLEGEGSMPTERSGYSFLFFDGDKSGEDIKALFKARLTEAEALLTVSERQDIIDTAQELFEDCIALVGMLDSKVRWQKIKRNIRFVGACMLAVSPIFFVLYFADY